MNLKSLLVSCVALMPTALSAATYYVSPDGAGSKDGSTPENAMDLAAFIAKAAANENGDVYNFAGGVYYPSETIIFNVGTGCTLNGATDGERTVFSGDNDSSNHPNEGDQNRLMRFQANTVHGNSERAIAINNIDFTCVYTQSSSDSDTMGALMIDNSGDVKVEGCNFYNNWAEGDQGGAAANLYRSTVYFHNCKFHDNSAVARGGAVRMHSNAATKGYTTFDQCVINNNTNYHNFGGAIFMAHGKQLNIINSTIFGNTTAGEGAAIYVNGAGTYPNELNIVGSTIVKNKVTGEIADAQISTTQTANVKVVNSIIVNDDELTSDFFFGGDTEDEGFSFVSGGWNCIGSILDGASEPEKEIKWQTTDSFASANTYSAIFGERTLDENGVVVPTKSLAGATGAQTGEAVATWELPEDLNLNVDQIGNPRIADSLPGACAKAMVSSVVEESLIGEAARIVSIGNGVYRIDGSKAGVEVYDIRGQKITYSENNIISLEGLAAGIYLIKSGNTVFKVLR